eukprot:CAMPEP_0176404354 /NCGR_PEP_ID=MMETSP0126-20121128/50795_1 /TAXON_ID=141414 ORGANISM="Strombidinopsis acuminatum, Strain SPMC142" /NCGR_SAMPLE_ID=MMETSP0126 /ASSEMBLY_ACC=CAM_ASM_000229 /LENGTH=34 /DNA_ID= /DNA_START= /DNA_END= /DNA_ORIENTATION=
MERDSSCTDSDESVTTESSEDELNNGVGSFYLND